MFDSIDSVIERLGAKHLDHPELAGPAVALPDGWKVESLEKLANSPSRVRQRLTVHRVTDFVDYVQRYKEPSSLIVFASKLSVGAPLAEAHLDYHHRDQLTHASWNEHRIAFAPQPSLAYAMLTALDGKLMDQAAFAQAIRDLTRFVEEPKAADLLEVIRTLTLTSKGDFQSYDDDLTGSVQLRFDLQVSANAGTQNRKLDVPRELIFKLPVLEGDGSDDSLIRAELLYRIPRGAGEKVQLGVRLPDRLWLERDLIQALADGIRQETGLLTIVGSVA
jgi:uncharacterized protein YfdQ (DUF2303 family)